MTPQFISPRQLARAAGVSESSVKRWCDQGLIPTVKTAGGHRRLTVEAAAEFLRQSGATEPRAELLMLPVRHGQGERAVRATADDFYGALVAGDESACARILLDRFLGGERVSRLGDQVVAPALHRVGAAWECHSVAVYQERRGCGNCLRAIEALRHALPSSQPSDPLAMGGSPTGDPYVIPGALVDLVLRHAGWRSELLGDGLPFETMTKAVQDAQPQLFWLSVSAIDDEQRFLDGYLAFYAAVKDEVAVVVGGRALHEGLRRNMEYAAYCDNLQHLDAFAQTLRRSYRKSQRREPRKSRKKVS